MSKVEKMHIADIIDKTNLYLTIHTLFEIWKEPEEIPGIPRQLTAIGLLEDNENLAYELMDDEYELYTFLLSYEKQIDKVKFLLILLKNYKERLALSKSMKIDPDEMKRLQEGIKGVKDLLKGIDRTFVYYELDGQKISHLTIINAREEAEGKTRRKQTANIERLHELKKDAHFGNIVQAIIPDDIQYVISPDPKIGREIRYMAEHNTIIDEFENGINALDKELTVEQIVEKIDRTKLIEEIINALEKNIEEIDMDKLLLCSAYRYIESADNGVIGIDEMKALKRRLEIIKTHIMKNVKITIQADSTYSMRDFEQDLKRFVGNHELVTFLSKEDIKQLRDGLLAGEISLNSLGEQRVNAINLDLASRNEILRKNPNNYIFFLRQKKCNYGKDKILNDIKSSRICSTDLLQLLCEKTDITTEDIRDLFDREIISVGDLNVVRNQIGTIISNEILFEKYAEYKRNNEQEARMQLERYALAYRNTELLGKTPEEIQDKGENFIAELGEEIEPADLIPLYGLDIITLKVAVDWGGENIIEELLESGRLKPADAKYLRDEGLLDEKVIERVFKKCRQMAYSEQVSLVSAVFDGQTKEEQEIRDRLAQYYNIENGMINPSTKGARGKRRNKKKDPDNEMKEKIKMRDPGAKYNLLASIDRDVTIEQGIIDGHIIFHYPNIDGGTVLIEKLHKIKNNSETGLIEIKADNESATYVLSEEEFIKMKSELIQEGKVVRTRLTEKWWKTRDPEHWISHAGIDCWEKALRERFKINDKNERYSQDDLRKIEKLIEKSIESKQR